MYIDLSNYLVFFLVMLRMTGMLITNPIFGRSNVPTMVNAGLALFLSILITSTMGLTPPSEPTFLGMFPLALKELAVGIIASFILRMFLSIFIIGGEIVDMQLAIGMAKVFDPGTNSSISLTSTLFNSMFVLIFFLTNNHLTFINMMALSYRIVPLATFSFNFEAFSYIPEYFTTVLLFAMKLCMPIVVVEIIVTMAVGIIMRVIPQINVFVVNIQFKLIIGIFALIMLVGPFTAYLENLVLISLEQIQYVWSGLAL